MPIALSSVNKNPKYSSLKRSDSEKDPQNKQWKIKARKFSF